MSPVRVTPRARELWLVQAPIKMCRGRRMAGKRWGGRFALASLGNVYQVRAVVLSYVAQGHYLAIALISSSVLSLWFEYFSFSICMMKIQKTEKQAIDCA